MTRVQLWLADQEHCLVLCHHRVSSVAQLLSTVGIHMSHPPWLEHAGSSTPVLSSACLSHTSRGLVEHFSTVGLFYLVSLGSMPLIEKVGASGIVCSDLHSA